MTDEPLRVQILRRGAEITAGDRNRSYGDPKENLGAAGEFKALFRKHMKRRIGPAEMEALDQVMTKLSRLCVGQAPGEDTYVDGATYFAIAGEVAQQERDEGWAAAAIEAHNGS